jgi:hypothetical protein
VQYRYAAREIYFLVDFLDYLYRVLERLFDSELFLAGLSDVILAFVLAIDRSGKTRGQFGCVLFFASVLDVNGAFGSGARNHILLDFQ